MCSLCIVLLLLQNEVKIAAIETAELDRQFFGGEAVQHLEIQGRESDKFMSHFKGIENFSISSSFGIESFSFIVLNYVYLPPVITQVVPQHLFVYSNYLYFMDCVHIPSNCTLESPPSIMI